MIFQCYKHFATKLFQNNHLPCTSSPTIMNDPNDWAREHDYPRYILDLFLRIIELSVRTIEIVRGLPDLAI